MLRPYDTGSVVQRFGVPKGEKETIGEEERAVNGIALMPA
jgi:hypothetical protein